VRATLAEVAFAWIELGAALVLAFALVMMARSGLRVSDMILISAAAWIGEDTCIRFYGFYQYDPRWTVFIDRVPLLIVLIWPVVILSGRELVKQLGGRGTIMVGLLVFYDASLVEPIAVQAGLWSWNEPGLFGVPLIGLLGWGYFSTAIALCLDRLRDPIARTATIVVAPIVTHMLLVASWWLAFRWTLRDEIAHPLLTAISIAVALALAAIVSRTRARASLEVMVPRMAAAAYFFVLLALEGGGAPALVMYAIAFAPPYLFATDWTFARALQPAKR
jgi:hypothetical protein